MTPEGSKTQPLHTEEAFCWWLAAFDERLAGAAVASAVAWPDEMGAPDELRERLEREAAWCQRVRRLWPQAAGTDPSVTSNRWRAGPSTLELLTAGLGRFVIRRELGRGTFGVVYLAYDPRLHREVALKVPRVEALVMPELRERFRKEAMAAAGLDHPHIVPVYEAGEEGAVCFIASAYCPGITLAAWLRRLREPVSYRVAAGLVATLAEAVEHAHRRGVLHRDLKPSNVLLEMPASAERDDEVPSDGYDPTLFPRVTDFGLAKLMDAPPEADFGSNPTLSGVIMGSPSYMAPEQAEGHAGGVGPAADIYSLGVILYELLTNRPPFQEDSALEILVLVRTQEPLPPSRLRPRLPRDLETICLKCLRKPPQSRYATAQALADDLRRFLAAEPILARPAPAWERAIKWVRRHPAMAAMAGSAAVAALTLAVVIGLANIRLQHERDRAESRRREAVANLRKAREAVDRMLTRVSEERLKDIPQVELVRRALLEDALEFYRDFARQAQDDPEVLFETSQAFGRLAVTYFTLGRVDEVERCYREALAIQQKLTESLPDVPQYRRALAESYMSLSKVWRDFDRYVEAEDALRRAIALLESLAATDPSEPRYLEGRATAYNLRATVHEDVGRLPEAEADYRRSLGQYDDLAARFPNVQRYRIRSAMARHNVASFVERDGRLDEAEKLYRSNADFWEALASSEPSVLDHRSRLALTFNNLADVLDRTGRKPEAERTFRRAADLCSALTRDYPNLPRNFDKLTDALTGLADIATDRGDLGEARRLQEEALASTQAALALIPGDITHRRWAGDVHAALIETLIRMGEHTDATKVIAKLVALFPDLAPECVRGAAFFSRCVPLAAADARLAATPRTDLARAYADRAIDLLGESFRRGYRDVEALKRDRNFDVLRSRVDFRDLLAEMLKPPAPRSP
jgi:eukaryotic-like serine/threonine-protein kinase